MALQPTPYVYQRRGGPLLSWAGGVPPYQSRAATLRTLGTLGDADVFGIQRPLLPVPGAPEFLDDPIDTLGAWDAIPSSSPPIRQRGFGAMGHTDCGCGCKGKKKGKCGKKGVGEYVATGDIVDSLTTPLMIGAAAYAVYALFIKKGGRRKKHSRAKEMYLRLKHK